MSHGKNEIVDSPFHAVDYKLENNKLILLTTMSIEITLTKPELFFFSECGIDILIFIIKV